MSAAVVQEDFGGFDPRFPGGIGLTFSSPDAHRVFHEWMDPSIGVSSSTSLAEIAIKSVSDHEVRHYHDALLSPMGGQILRFRIQALINGSQTIAALRERPGDALPVPLGRWLALDPERRASYEREWTADFGEPLTAVDLPPELNMAAVTRWAGQVVEVDDLGEDEALLMRLTATVGAYDRTRRLLTGPELPVDWSDLRPSMIFEVSALASQIASIRQAQGEAEVLEFLMFLLDSERPYAQLWRRFTELALTLTMVEYPGRQPHELMLVAQIHVLRMATWCLLGDPQLDGDDACPTRRFLVLAAHVAADPAAAGADEGDVATVWTGWDKATATRPWREGCTASLASALRALSLYEEVAGRWAGDRALPDLVLRVMRRRIADQQRVVGVLLADPEVFANPLRYVNMPEGALPVPCLRVDLDGFAVPLPPDSPVRVLTRTVDGAAARYALSFDGALGAEWLDALIRLEADVCACDLVFSDHTMPWLTFDSAREHVQGLVDKRVVLLV